MNTINSSYRGASCFLFIFLLGFLAVASEAQCADAFFNTGQLAEGRNSHTATLLANGKVLIAGGKKAGSNTTVSSAEIYDPIAQTSVLTGSLAAPRVGHRAVLLPNGKVLVAGGIATAELYDPATGAWQDTSPVEDPFFANSCTVLANGKVLVIGGTDATTQTAKAKLYDPLGNSWTATGSLATVKDGRSAVLLQDGRVLVAGGFDPATKQVIVASDVYDPESGAWTSTGPLGTPRNSPNIQRLANGKVIAIGGSSGTIITAELFDPATRSWTATGSLTKERLGFSAVPLADNTVLVTGGFQNTNPSTTILASSEIYNPATGIWKRVDSMNTLRCLHQATLLPDGTVLITGGWGYNNPAVFGDFNHGVKPAETYSPVAGHWRTTGPLNNRRYNHAATRLADGRILVTGGTGDAPEDPAHPIGPLAIAEIYNPATGTWAETANAAPRFGSSVLLGDNRVFSFDGFSAQLYEPVTGIWSSGGSVSGRSIATVLKNGIVLVTGSSDGKTYHFDPATNTWSDTGSSGGPVGSHVTAVLPDGKVLAVGGYASRGCAVHDPLSGTWSTTGATIAYRSNYATAAALPNGKILLCGGLGDSNFPLITTEIYNPGTGTWAAGSPMGKNHLSPLAIRLDDGRILVTGGANDETANCAEIYDAMADEWTPTAPLTTSRSAFTGTLLANGQVLAAGGYQNGVIVATSELYDPGNPKVALEEPAGAPIPWGETCDFGEVMAGEDYSRQFSIRNVGADQLAGLKATLSGPDAADFSITTAPSESALAPDQTTTVIVRFSPISPGEKTALLHISSSDTGEIPFSIHLTATAPPPDAPEIVIEQPPSNSVEDGQTTQFGSPALSTHADLQFTIRNAGQLDLIGLGLTIVGTDAADFTVSQTLSATVISPGATAAFTVRFSPASLGTRTATLRVASNDSDENPFDIHLTGSGSPAPTPEIAIEQPSGADLTDGTTTKDFGNVITGGGSELHFVIRNSGAADLTGLAVVIDGANAGSFLLTGPPSATVAAPGGEVAFTVRFSPVSLGIQTATLHVASNDSDETPFDIHLTGNGTATPVPEIAIEQPAGVDLADGTATSDFGKVLTGGVSDLRFTIRNSGTAALTGLAVVIDGTNAGSFLLTVPLSTTVVVPGGVVVFTVRFAPTTAGTMKASLHLASNDDDEGQFHINLTGIASQAVPEIVVEQPVKTSLVDGKAKKSFGTLKVGKSGAAKTFTIRNTGTALLSNLSVKKDGNHKGDFTVGALGKTTLAPGASTTFKGTFKPGAKGTRNATIHIRSDDRDENPFDIKLTGMGASR